MVAWLHKFRRLLSLSSCGYDTYVHEIRVFKLYSDVFNG
ncbi:hypothetical protein F383_32065 [Gossypium arboreum]|uniref:Uncharacterized protein n=1 Tax=Gossypium arboreum TaxID=29729 RepID=A0A0B0PKE5_GOSAR|nr:hypothetical protein F383_32065 [Gossypium arboreum]